MMDLAILIEIAVPGADYSGSVTGNDQAAYDSIVWKDAREKPSFSYLSSITTAAKVPSSVTMRQARLALLASGHLAGVDAAIDALPEPQQSAARIEWDYSSEVVRNKPFVALLGAALELDNSQIDQLFITAAGL